MDSGYPGDAWSRLRDWLKTQIENMQGQIMSGACNPDDYRALCLVAARMQDILDQMKLIQSGEDILGKHTPSPLRQVE